MRRGQRPKLGLSVLGPFWCRGAEGAPAQLGACFLGGGYIVTTHLVDAAQPSSRPRRVLSVQAPRPEQFVICRVLVGMTDTLCSRLERLDHRIE